MGKHITPEQRAEMAELYTSYLWSSTHIARLFGCTPKCVLGNLRRAGVTIRSTGHSRRGFPWSEKIKKKLKSDYADGQTIRAIAAREGIDEKTLSDMLKREGITIRNGRPGLDWGEGQKDRICEQYLAGVRLMDIAHEHGINHVTILSMIRRRGIQLRSKKSKVTT